VTVYRRANNWKAELHTAAQQEIAFNSICLKMKVADVYESVTF
jgi:hypothetical protein